MNKLIIIIIGLGIAGLGYWINKSNLDFVNGDLLEKYTSICDNKASTNGRIQEEYRQKGNSYTLFYDYEVDGNKYTLQKYGNEEPTLDMYIAEIFYDSTNPSKATFDEPCELKSQQATSDGNKTLFYVGYALMIIGGFTAYSTFRGLFRKKGE